MARSVSSAIAFSALWNRSLIEDMPDKKRAHLPNVFGGLYRGSHILHQLRKRVELWTDKPDDELIVIAVEPMALEPDIDRQT